MIAAPRRPPDVSIVIPTRDRPALLRRSLASALAQTGAAVEVIVVDDGSDPPAQVTPSPAVTLIRTGNRGASSARNAGLERARGAYVLFLDSDDWLEPDAVDNLLGTIRARGASVAFARWRNVEAGTVDTGVVVPAVPYVDGLANAAAGGWVAGSFLMSRAIAARFDPALTIWEVVVFLCESLAGGGAAAACGAVTVNVSQHGDPDRISIRHDHFEPLATARIFAALKARLASRGRLDAERIAALDGRLLACLNALLRDGRPEAREVHGAIDWAEGRRSKRHRPASFGWCAQWGGLAGARGFVALNRMLGR